MSLIDQYEDLETKIKERALHVNNLVAEYISANNINDDSYRFSWCGVADLNYLDFTICGHKIILEFDAGDGWPSQWDVPAVWVDYSDEDIIEDYLLELNRRREIDKLTSIQKLEQQAKELGFVLSKQ